MFEQLYEHHEWLWTFVDEEGIEATNNASKRSLRHAVTWRELSFGTPSARGNCFVATMLTAIETCRYQSRNLFQFLSQTLKAHFRGHPIASLLPTL